MWDPRLPFSYQIRQQKRDIPEDSRGLQGPHGRFTRVTEIRPILGRRTPQLIPGSLSIHLLSPVIKVLFKNPNKLKFVLTTFRRLGWFDELPLSQLSRPGGSDGFELVRNVCIPRSHIRDTCDPVIYC